MGLPPWAAWCRKLGRKSVYRMVNPHPGVHPDHPHNMHEIWHNERVRSRFRASRKAHHVYEQLKYPWMTTGVWYSDILDHWVQVPHVRGAQYAIEQDGGFDNFILKRSGPQLKSKYGERFRRHILVRQKEIQKNHVLQLQAHHLAATVLAQLQSTDSLDDRKRILEKYGMGEVSLN
jgi:hypothetical protein